MQKKEVSIFVYLFAFTFFAKAFFLAFWVTPLWDIQDETGHFSYARDIGMGKGIQLLGEARMGKDVLANLYGRPVGSASPNWIYQHPPVFHMLAGFVWKLNSLVSSDTEYLFKSTRLLAGLAGAGSLIVIFNVLQLFGISRFKSIAALAFIAYLPMYTNMSSGTSHDTLVTLFGCLSVYYWTRFIFHEHIGDAYWSAFWLSVGAATKMTVLVMAAPMVAIMIFELSGRHSEKIKHAAGISLLALLLPGFWMIRNYIAFENPFATFTTSVAKRPLHDQPLQESFLSYLSNYPVFEHFFVQFYGFFGWVGTGLGNLRMQRISGFPLTFYSILSALILVLLTVAFFRKRSFCGSKPLPENSFKNSVGVWFQGIIEKLKLSQAVIIGFFVFSIMMFTLTVEHVETANDLIGYCRKLIFGLLVFLIVNSATVFFKTTEKQKKVQLYSQVIIGFFVAIFLWQLYKIFQGYGAMRGVHGRYLYPVLSLFFISFLVPVLKNEKAKPWIFLLLALGLSMAEIQTYTQQVFPFYKVVKPPMIVPQSKLEKHVTVGDLVEGFTIEQNFQITDKDFGRARIAGPDRAVCVSIWLSPQGRSTNSGLLDLELRRGRKRESVKIDMSEVKATAFQDPVCFNQFKADQFTEGLYRLTLRGISGQQGSAATTLLTSDKTRGTAVINGNPTSRSMFFSIRAEPIEFSTFNFEAIMITIFNLLGFTIILIVFLNPEIPVGYLSNHTKSKMKNGIEQ